MDAATRMTPMGRILDGLSRAAVLLKEHDDQAPPIVTITTGGRVELLVLARLTFSEEGRRHSVDVYAESTHAGQATVKDGYYTATNDHWHITTPVKPAACGHCGSTL